MAGVAKMAAAAVSLLMITLSTMVSFVSACVPPTCVYVTHRPDMIWENWSPNSPYLSSGFAQLQQIVCRHKMSDIDRRLHGLRITIDRPAAAKNTDNDLNNPWMIAIIVLSCIFFVILLFMLIWFCCYCCYRDNAAMAPRVLRRIIRVQHPVKEKVVEPPRRILHVVAPPPPQPPPPPPPPPQPSEKVVVVPAACPEPPQSLLLSVSEGLHPGNNGPGMTTVVDKPLTFTLSPQPDGIRHSGLRVHDHITTMSGHVDCTCHGHGCCSGCG